MIIPVIRAAFKLFHLTLCRVTSQRPALFFECGEETLPVGCQLAHAKISMEAQRVRHAERLSLWGSYVREHRLDFMPQFQDGKLSASSKFRARRWIVTALNRLTVCLHETAAGILRTLAPWHKKYVPFTIYSKTWENKQLAGERQYTCILLSFFAAKRIIITIIIVIIRHWTEKIEKMSVEFEYP